MRITIGHETLEGETITSDGWTVAEMSIDNAEDGVWIDAKGPNGQWWQGYVRPENDPCIDIDGLDNIPRSFEQQVRAAAARVSKLI